MHKVRNSIFILAGILAGTWVIVPAAQLHALLDHAMTYGQFFFLGLLGAIVANSTGSGGGVVFIPSFNALGFSAIEALGTSIMIQCFGMTVGSMRWLHAASKPGAPDSHRDLLRQLLPLAGIATIIGVMLGQHFVAPPEGYSVARLFRYFSIVFGMLLLHRTIFARPRYEAHVKYRLGNSDAGLVIVAGLGGGLLTAWISIGIGELIALLLIFRGYPTMVAIAVGVCMSSIACLSAVIQHSMELHSINWQVIAYAAPAAVIGAGVARALAVRLGPARLKIFFGVWILATGIAMGS